MRLPLILASENLPVPSGPRMPADSGALEGVAVAGRRLEALGLHVTQQEAAVEAEKQKQAEADAALQHWSALSTSLGDMEAGLKQGTRDAQGNLVTPPADSITYKSAFQKQAADLAAQAQANAKDNPNVQRLLNNLYTRWTVHAFPGASVDANRLFMQEQGATITTEVPIQAERLAKLAETDPAQYQTEKAVVETWLAQKSMVFGAEKSAKMVEQLGQNVAWNVARRAIDKNPAADWSHVAGQMPDTMITKMDEYQARKIHQRQIETDQAEKAAEKQDAKLQGQLYGGLLAQAMDKAPGTLDMIEAAGPRGTNELKPHDYEHLRAVLVKPQDGPSDPATKSAVINGVAVMSPKYNPAQITALNQRGLLNDQDTKWALEHLQRSQERGLAQQNTIAAHQQAEAERITNTLLNPAAGGLLAKLDDRATQLKAQMQTTLLEKSVYFGVGKEMPRDVLLRELPPLVRQFKTDVADEVKRRAGEVAKLEFKSVPDLEAAYAAKRISKAKYDAAWGTINSFVKAQERLKELDTQMENTFGKR